MFGYYSRFISEYKKNQNELFKSLIKVKFVDYDFEETEEKYGENLFPNKMSKDEVIDYIKNLSSCLNFPQE